QIPTVNLSSCYRVRRIAVALRPFAGDAKVDTVIEKGKIDHSFETAIFIVSDVGRSHRFKLIGGFGGRQIHHASRRIAPIKRALWPTQNFDLSYVIKFLLEEVVANERYVVQSNSNGGIGRYRDRLGTDAADLDGIPRKIGLRKRQIRNLLHQIRATRCLRGRELFLR